MSDRKSKGSSSSVHRSISLNEHEQISNRKRENDDQPYTKLSSNPGMKICNASIRVG
ncbi:unnamed protein product, partial [Rotaria sp. Silwood1]